jgi:hypothetical protein
LPARSPERPKVDAVKHVKRPANKVKRRVFIFLKSYPAKVR